MQYSKDLREKVLKYIEFGNKKSQASKVFGVCRGSIYNWLNNIKNRGTILDEVPKRRWRKLNPKLLISYVEKFPNKKLKEHAAYFKVSDRAIGQAFEKLKITRKKKTNLYRERDEAKRNIFLASIEGKSKEDLVYIDESGIDKYLYNPYGWSIRGKKVYGEISGKRYNRESFIAGKVGSRIIAPFCFSGTCNTALFNAWVEQFLIPELVVG